MRLHLFALLLASTACGAPELCAPGTLFRTVLQLDPSSATTNVALVFERGSAGVPNSYYAAVTPHSLRLLDPSNDSRWVVPTGATLTAPNRFDVTLPRNVELGVRFRLGFPVRPPTAACPRQERRDEFVLDVTIDRSSAGYLSWQELVLLGGSSG
jgi:hypothetical protein